MPTKRADIGWGDRALSAVLASIGDHLYAEQIALVIDYSRRANTRNSELTETDFDLLLKSLVFAEDRKFWLHKGTDILALGRALWVFVLRREVQGASTITQQLVRVSINDYRRTAYRKLKEMCIACAVDQAIPKRAQAIAYLKIAYYGWRMQGCDQAVSRLEIKSPLTPRNSAEIIARLRFPEPQHSTDNTKLRIRRRANYIESFLAGGAHAKNTSADAI